MDNYKELFEYNKNLLDIIEMQNPRAVQEALDYHAEERETDIRDELQDEWCGSLVKTKDGSIHKITYMDILGHYHPDIDGFDDEDIECICEKDNTEVEFTLKYAKENLVRKGESNEWYRTSKKGFER